MQQQNNSEASGSAAPAFRKVFQATLDVGLRMSGEARRLLSALRKRASKREQQVSLSEYLAANYAGRRASFVRSGARSAKPRPGSRAPSDEERTSRLPDGHSEDSS